MAANLVKAGHTVTGFDLNPAALEALAKAGGKAADSAADAAEGAQVVITMLPAGEHVRQVFLHQGGLIDEVKDARPLLIDCSTIDVDTAREVTAAAAEVGSGDAGRPGLRRHRGRAERHADLHGRRHGRGVRLRQADPGGDGQEHLPRRRTGRRTGGQDLQQHDAGHQHGRRRGGVPAGAEARPGLGQAAPRSAPPRRRIPGRCRVTVRRPVRCRRRRPTATTPPGSPRR